MRVLAIDIGGGTQDILLWDTSTTAENAIQLVLPSPTVLVAQRISRATARKEPVVLVGETMGGGPCTTALREHLEAGQAAYATEQAALTFHDDLKRVASWGVRLVSHDEAKTVKGTVIRTADVDLGVLQKALATWGIPLAPQAVAVAVLDHGFAPDAESQRLSRFRHLERLLQKSPSLESFIFTRQELPDYLTRMQAVVHSVGEYPLVVMDTGPAAALGALLDRAVGAHQDCLTVNLGNSHALAFNLSGTRVLGMLEHHTGMLTREHLEALLDKLVSGRLKFREVWEEGGHGSLVFAPGDRPFLTVTGPRRKLLASSPRQPYCAAPFGSMMLAGGFGLVRAVAVKYPQWREELQKALLLP